MTLYKIYLFIYSTSIKSGFMNQTALAVAKVMQLKLSHFSVFR